MGSFIKTRKKSKKGHDICFGDNLLKAEILDILDGGNRLVKFYYEGIFEEVLDKVGIVPLPPYITEKLSDKERYQTIYSKYNGSAAAPTAGLHFTKELMADLEEVGVKIAELTLHVGIGTFRPVKTSNIEEHHMHSEHFVIDKKAADIINNTRKTMAG